MTSCPVALWLVCLFVFVDCVSGTGADDLFAMFPKNLANVLKRVADAKCIPYGGMVAGILGLMCTFSPSSWCSSVGGHDEPLLMTLKMVGISGINKTGAMRYFEHVFKAVRMTLVDMSSDASLCLENGFRVLKSRIPQLDYTATQAAFIQKLSNTGNLLGLVDEHATMMRQMINGSSGGVVEGSQSQLVLYNGPCTFTNELKSSFESAVEPRYNSVTGIQPPIAKSDFGVGTSLFNVGLTSRATWLMLEPNMLPDSLPVPLAKDEQTVFEFVLAAAVRSFFTVGDWVPCDDADAIAKDFTGVHGSELHPREQEALRLQTSSFVPTGLGEAAAAVHADILATDQLNNKKAFELIKAKNKGENPAGRFLVENEVPWSGGDETTPALWLSAYKAAFFHVRIFEFVPGSVAEALMKRAVLDAQKEIHSLPDSDPRKNMLGKDAGKLARAAGIMQVISVASEDVGVHIGENSLVSQGDTTEFVLDIVEQMKEEGKLVGVSRDFGISSERESLLPAHFFEPICQEAVQRAAFLQAMSRNASEHLFLDTQLRASGDSLAPEPLVASPMEEGPTGSSSTNSPRGNTLIKEACIKNFRCASLSAVLPTLRQRASQKGSNACPSELFYLKEIQDFPLLAVAVRGKRGSFKYYILKRSTAALPLPARLKAAHALARVGLTLDQFEASVAAGPEVLPTGDIPEVELPYSLLATEIPALFAMVAAAPDGALETADRDSGVLQLPPPATQERARGSMDDDHNDDSGDDGEYDNSDAENDQQQPRDKRPREGEKTFLKV